MKLSSFLLLVIVLQAWAVDSYSQRTKLTLNLKNATLEDALKAIENQSEFYFLYSPKMVDVSRKVDIELTDKKIDFILIQMFAGTGVDYVIKDRQIVITTDEMIKPFKKETPQQIVVTGKVTDEDGITLPGVNIIIKKTLTGTTTDVDGNYRIEVENPDVVLVFTFVGMFTQEIKVGDQTEINITLVQNVIGIDEIVTIGYGTLQRKEITSAITSVKSDEFVKGSISNVAKLIQGKVAGLTITTTSGSPTASPEILLRGVGTLKSGVSPLVIIDGIPGSLNQVVPENIESIDILKDGSAAAIYGTRGSNGVILITTKKVKGITPSTVEFTSYFTTDRISKQLDFLDATEFRRRADEVTIEVIDHGSETDWQDQIYQKPVSQAYNLSLSKGDLEYSYYANVNYKTTDGLIKRSDNNVLNTKLGIFNSLFENKLRTNANFIGRMQNYYPGDWGDVYEQAITRNPTDLVVDEDGNWMDYPAIALYENPMALLYEKEGEVRNTTLKLYGNIELDILPGLMAKVTGSYEDNNSLTGSYYTHSHIRNLKNGEGGGAARSAYKSRINIFESTLQYKKVFNDSHNIKLLLGQSWQESINESFNASNHLYPTDFYTWNNLRAGQGLFQGTANLNSSKVASKLIGYFFRGNYNYKDKYLLMASLRREGSSKFGENNKWGFFPAVSGGWNLMNESFMQNVEFLSSLKFRVGYGLTGTIPSNSYASLRKLTYDTGLQVFNNGEWIAPLITTSNPNPNLRWEKKAETNIGIDIGFFNHRLTGSIDLYHRKTTDIIWDYSVPSPPNLYTSVLANAGSMENKGLEVFLSGIPVQTANWSWTSSANYSTNRNKLLSLSNEEFQNENPFINIGDAGRGTREYTHRLEEGGPIGNFYGYKTVDIDENGMWLVETDDGPKLLIDAVEDDKQVIGNGMPKHFLNWSNSVKYKNFSLDVVMRGAFDYQIYNQASCLFGIISEFRRNNILASSFNPVYGKVLSPDQSSTYVSHFLEEGDFWKIDNITLAYDWGVGDIISAIQSLRVFASVTNILTLTGYTGIDPEVTVTSSNARTPGFDYVSEFPATRTFTVGLIVQLK